jgi:putative membrane protein
VSTSTGGPAAPGTIRTLVTGAAMGAADLVPGFSGGTVALVAGVYPRLVANIRAAAHVVSLTVRLRSRSLPAALRALDWSFLLVLLGGIVGTAFLLASTLRGLLTAQPVVMSAVFLGLVLGAAVTARRQLEAPPSGRTVVIVVVTAGLTALVLGVRPDMAGDPSRLVLAATAAVAVCAMILPGVSGSFLLLLLGTYAPVIAAVADRDIATIGVVALGAVVGLLAFSTLLHWALRRAHDVVLAALIGLMVGSARVLWPWPSATGVGDPAIAAPGEQTVPAFAAGLVALLAVLVVDRLLSRGAVPDGPRPPSDPSPRGTR